jgi:Uma2 family endonuclease
MVATRHVTIEEFAAISGDGQWELINGEPTELTPASSRSSRVGGRIYAQFVQQLEDQGLGWAYPADAGFILFDDRSIVRSPDAAFVSRDRLPNEPAGFVPVAPDLAVEVLSPSDRMADALSKVAMYLEAGVLLVWLVDPERESVTVFQADGGIDIVHGDASLDGGKVTPGLTILLAEIFAER